MLQVAKTCVSGMKGLGLLHGTECVRFVCTWQMLLSTQRRSESM